MTIRRLILLTLTISLLLSGCTFGSGKVVGIDVNANTTNIDPQYLTDKTGELVVGNIFEGLVVKNKQGEIVSGAAERWDISASGLVYTFYLRENAHWESWNREEKTITSMVTAGDFVFGLSRMFYSTAPSPYVKDFLSIENGRKVVDGELTLESLGIKALSTNTLEIRLEEPDQLFLEKLTSPGALPCNEEFFNTTKGRYGTEAPLTLSNGPYTIKSWADERITLTANPAYHGQEAVPFEKVNINIRMDDYETKLSRFLKESTQVTVLNEPLEEQKKNIITTQFVGSNWSLVFNTKSEPTNIPLIRQGFAYTTKRENLKPILDSNFITSRSLFPVGTSLGGQELELIAPLKTVNYNEAKGLENFQFGLSQLGLKGETVTFTLCLPEGEQVEYMKTLIPNWERALGCKVKLAPLPEAEYRAQIESGDFEMALVSIPTLSQQPTKILEDFARGDMQKMIKYDSIIYKELLDTIYSGKTYEETARYVRNSESLLLIDAVIIPLYSEISYCAQWGSLQEITVYPMEQLIRFYQV